MCIKICLSEIIHSKATMDSLTAKKASFVFPFLLLLLISLCNLKGASSSVEEVAALLKWKANFKNQNNPLLSSWSNQPTNGSNSIENANCYTWYGVSCIHGRINRLSLRNSSIKGTLESFPFSSLPNLEYLDLSMNKFFGSIPPQIGDLTNLTLLSLHHN